MAYTLAPLPYAFDALEPYIDAKTMELHYTKHHQTYLDNLNAAIEKHPMLGTRSVRDLLRNLDAIPADIRTTVQNNGGGVENHTLFWQWMKKNGGGQPSGKLAQEIEKKFGSFTAFQERMNTAAKSRFGSGWAWLVLDTKGNLEVTSTANQDCPVSQGCEPLLGLDVWEHAYYLKYNNRRVDYITAWWHVVNWDFVHELYQKHG